MSNRARIVNQVLLGSSLCPVAMWSNMVAISHAWWLDLPRHMVSKCWGQDGNPESLTPGHPLLPSAAAAAKSHQSCPTLCDPIDGSPPGSPIPGILQVRTLEWVAISFSNVWKGKVKVKSLSRVPPLATPWTAAYQAPPSMVFSRQEY